LTKLTITCKPQISHPNHHNRTKRYSQINTPPNSHKTNINPHKIHYTTSTDTGTMNTTTHTTHTADGAHSGQNKHITQPHAHTYTQSTIMTKEHKTTTITLMKTTHTHTATKHTPPNGKRKTKSTHTQPAN